MTAIYEATFRAGRETARVDVLARVGDDEWELIEVKSSSSLKKEHLEDVAFQARTVRAAGVGLASVRVMHPNGDYVRTGALDLNQFFESHDLTIQATAIEEAVTLDAKKMHRTVRASEAPSVETGTQCRNPVRCPFFDHCHMNST